MAHTTTLSSLGVSAAIILNPVPKATTVQVTVASGSSGANVFLQYTLDNPSNAATPSVTWAALSSAIVSSNADLLGGVTYTMLSPIGGLRLSSTTAVTGTITLKALQSVTA